MVKNTLIINFFGIILGLIVPISLAIFLNEMRLGIYKRVVQSVMFFPYFLSWVVVGAIVYGLLATDVGVVNNVLKSMDMEPVRWFAEPKYWKTILIAANVWKWSGYNSIVYLAAITNFDPNLFEAAQVDGASRFQQILHLTIPMLKPTAVVLTLLSVGRIFYGDFGMVYGIVGENPILVDAVNVIDTYVYRSMRSLGFSYGTAVGLMYALTYWNDWWNALMFIEKKELFPLQYFLYGILSNVNAISSGRVPAGVTGTLQLPAETVKMAVTIITIGPIIFLYPFIQKYFVSGVMSGAVKE